MCQFPLFETLAIINGRIQQIEYHQRRYEWAIKHYFKEKVKYRLAEVIEIPSDKLKGFFRCRIDYNAEAFCVQFFDYMPKKITQFICIETENIDYRFKYSDRTQLDLIEKLPHQEIIIMNNSFVSDCSIGNLLFLKQAVWYSPRHYLLLGTQLTRLIDEQKVEWADISARSLFDYEKIMMINALNPFDLSRAIPITCDTILMKM